MCGRYVRRATKKAIADWFGVDPEHLPESGPSFNIAPQTFQPVVRLSPESGEREIVLMRWGLVPFWARDARASYAGDATGHPPDYTSVVVTITAMHSIYAYGLNYLNNQITTTNDTVNGSWQIGYDNLNRLTTGVNFPNASQPQYLCWTYDAYGNRLQQTISNQAFTGANCATSGSLLGNTVASYTAGTNRMSQTNAGGTITTPAYDAAGNTTGDQANRYLYDGEGRICAVGLVNSNAGMMQYIYDAEGNRVGKGTIQTFSCDITANGFQAMSAYVLGPNGEQMTEMAISTTQVAGQPVTTAGWVHTNVMAAGELIATYVPGHLHYQLSDWLGTRRMQTDENGANPQTFTSLPFGDGMTASGGNDATEQHFTDKERDAESGNDDFGARYYSSSLGRFMSPDWSVKIAPVPYAKLGLPQSLNLYAYVLNNPIAGVDLDGHDSCADQPIACATVTDEMFAGGKDGGGVDAATAMADGQAAQAMANAQTDSSAQQQGASSSQSQSNASRAQTQLLFAIPYIAKQLGVSYETAYNNLSLALTPDGQPIVIGGHANFVYSDMATVQRALENANEGGDYKNGSGDKFARLGSTPSTHLDKVDVKFGHGNDGLIHLDRFNGGNPKYTLQHFGYDVVLGHIYGSTPMLPY